MLTEQEVFEAMRYFVAEFGSAAGATPTAQALAARLRF
jgi:hypothetical protein